ncbi:MAG: HAMP domain-containing sensor histidine kinase [Candidatus Electryonea clarkiae]|nr:HAMP domain-containing sensor histidine kinase [Candidatus Electryonea clarkiae]MDP8286284.1 HAMP domain-containing sensor histidine kinase [Candidatus Electryonea clarkiae]
MTASMHEEKENNSGSLTEDSIESSGKFPPPLHRLGFLVAGIVHNLFGPLTAIMGIVDLLKLKHPEFTKDFEQLTRLSRKLKDEISAIMEKAGLDGSIETTQIDFMDLLNTELDFFKCDPRFKHKLKVYFHSDPDVPFIEGVYSDFAMTIDHLLANAIESMDKTETKVLNISVKHQQEFIYIIFEDTGCGMDERTIQHAFDPFYTTKTADKDMMYPLTRATGIGLSHAKHLMEPYGCTILLESEVNIGSKISLKIPT